MMGGGAGHIQDMVNKIKENKARRIARKESRDRYRNLSGGTYNNKLQFKKVSKEELASINQRNRNKARKERIKKNAIAVLIFVPVFIVVIFYLQKSIFMTLK